MNDVQPSGKSTGHIGTALQFVATMLHNETPGPETESRYIKKCLVRAGFLF